MRESKGSGGSTVMVNVVTEPKSRFMSLWEPYIL